jgi:uncharacterized RDD family membrane protein YckC
MATAGWCSDCNANVWVGPDGGCEHGHPRSSLRGLYEVQATNGQDAVPIGTQPVAGAIAPSTGPARPEYAGFGVRFGARLIDFAVVNALALITGVVGGFVVGIARALQHQPVRPAVAAMSGWTLALSLMAAFAFHALAEGIHGSTPGKMMLGLTVLDSAGGFCKPGAALGRELAFYVDALFFGIIAYTSMKESGLRQRLGDKWARTVVVHRRSLQPAQRRSTGRFVAALAASCLAYSALALASLLTRL